MGGAFGRLEVVADYEWEAFHQVDVRRDWLIRDILLVNREPVFRATGMERLDITADSRSHMHYLVKLEPAQSEGPGMVPTAASTEVDAIEAVVREWHREEGWGVVDSPQDTGWMLGPLQPHPVCGIPRTWSRKNGDARVRACGPRRVLLPCRDRHAPVGADGPYGIRSCSALPASLGFTHAPCPARTLCRSRGVRLRRVVRQRERSRDRQCWLAGGVL